MKVYSCPIVSVCGFGSVNLSGEETTISKCFARRSHRVRAKVLAIGSGGLLNIIEKNSTRLGMRIPAISWKSLASLLGSLVQGLSFFLVLYTVFRYLRFPYFMTVRRITYPFEFNATMFGSESWDVSGLLFLLPLSLVLFLRFKINRFVDGILTVLLMIELLASVHLALLPIGIANPVLSHFVNSGTQLFYSLGVLSKYLMILLVAAAFYGLSVRSPPVKIKPNATIPSTSMKEWVFLVLSMLLSLLAAWYPYSLGINPRQISVSVDTPQYVKFVNEMLADPKGVLSAFSGVNRGDRPIALITIYALYQLTGIQLSSLVDHLPVVLGPLLVFSVYVLAKSVFRGSRIPLVASFLTAVSHYIVVGIYGGFFANWFALILMMPYLLFVIKASNAFDVRNLAVSSLILILILFTHPYTWTPLLLSTSLFFLVTLTGNIATKALSFAKATLILTVPNMVAEIVKNMLLNSVGGFAADYAVASTGVSIEQFFLRFSNLDYTFTTYVGGYLSNPFVILLSVISVIVTRGMRLTKLISALLISVSFPVFFGDYVIQSRLIYLIPFPILAAVLMGQSKLSTATRKRVVLLVFAISLNYAFWALANLASR